VLAAYVLQGTEGGGMSLQLVTNASLTCLVVTNNTASGAAGGLALLRSDAVLMKDCVFDGNVASLGGGIAVDSSSIEFVNVTLETNTAAAADRHHQVSTVEQLLYPVHDALPLNYRYANACTWFA
jgi:predicted outer membrane repeat protein